MVAVAASREKTPASSTPARLIPTGSSITSMKPMRSRTSPPSCGRLNVPGNAASGRALDETFFHSQRKVDMNLRWVYVHMIEEYARHNGHADLLRERLDGATGC